ncbi:Alkaline/neutral invertase [Forsythia ovata]|uniref:Alkaline/neutral invertase n=1 Tax=Forsythia ovata TaxID=205694 RepID=A0ABD1RYP4_9LAMI
MPDSLPDWVFDFMPTRGGYFIGNVSPARMDFRWFCLSNCIAILSSLATPKQASAIMDLIESRWEEFVGEMPLKICYPAMESHEWRIVTGCDPKNTGWTYHNGGSWPVLLWLLTAACIKSGRPQLARRAIELAEARLLKDHWPEYYDGKLGRYIGKQARKNQTWSIFIRHKHFQNKYILFNISLCSFIQFTNHKYNFGQTFDALFTPAIVRFILYSNNRIVTLPILAFKRPGISPIVPKPITFILFYNSPTLRTIKHNTSNRLIFVL